MEVYMKEKYKALKLDSSYRPVQIVSSFEAFCMVFLGRANLIETYRDEYFHSSHERFLIPSVISLNRYIKRDKLNLKCNRKNVFWRDKNVCQYCSNKFPIDKLTLDHVTPRSKGGPKTWENIVTCCKKCNQIKGDKLPIEANMKPIKVPVQPSSHMFHMVEKKNIHETWLPYLFK